MASSVDCANCGAAVWGSKTVGNCCQCGDIFCRRCTSKFDKIIRKHAKHVWETVEGYDDNPLKIKGEQVPLIRKFICTSCYDDAMSAHVATLKEALTVEEE